MFSFGPFHERAPRRPVELKYDLARPIANLPALPCDLSSSSLAVRNIEMSMNNSS